jgi:hypothetical protein
MFEVAGWGSNAQEAQGPEKTKEDHKRCVVDTVVQAIMLTNLKPPTELEECQKSAPRFSMRPDQQLKPRPVLGSKYCRMPLV